MKRAADDANGDEKRAKFISAALDHSEKLATLEQAMASYDAAEAEAARGGGGAVDETLLNAARESCKAAADAAARARAELLEQVKKCAVVPPFFKVNKSAIVVTEHGHRGLYDEPEGLLAFVRDKFEKQKMMSLYDRTVGRRPVDVQRIDDPDAETYAKLILLWPHVQGNYVVMYNSADANSRFLDRLVYEYERWCYDRYREGEALPKYVV